MGLFDRFRKTEDPAAGKTRLVPGVGRTPYPAYRGKEPYIFVSYSHRDSDLVFAEIKRLNELGYRVWYDEGIAPGNEWTDEIANALERCAAFIVFFTPASAESDNVQNEIDFVIDDKKPCVGVYLQEATLRGRTRLRFGMKQAIMKYAMTEEEYVYKLVSAMERFGLKRDETISAPAETPFAPAETPSAPVETPSAPAGTPSAPVQPAGGPEYTRAELDAMIQSAMHAPVRMTDFEWIGRTVKAYHGITKRFEVPDRAESLMSYAFKGNPAIEEITLPACVDRVGAAAFCNCANLETIVFCGRSVAFDEVGPVQNCPKASVKCHKGSATHDYLQTHFNGRILFFDGE